MTEKRRNGEKRSTLARRSTSDLHDKPPCWGIAGRFSSVDKLEQMFYNKGMNKGGMAMTDGESLYRLAMAHIYGDGVAEDNVLAAKLLTEARALGHVEAAYNLGICYHYGYGVDVDLETAYGLYLESANAGYGKGMELVGRFFSRGIYVEKDRERAAFWLQKAMESGDPEAEAEALKELEGMG